MMNVEVTRFKSHLDHLFSQVAHIEDTELQSHWAKYLCVLVSGFIETSIKAIYSEYVKRKAAPYVANYVGSALAGFQNPKMEKIISLAASFNPDWADRLRAATEGELKDSVDSIVANRNLIAHGQSSGVTYARVKQWYVNVVKVIEKAEAIINGQ